jgi:hypothetical protein
VHAAAVSIVGRAGLTISFEIAIGDQPARGHRMPGGVEHDAGTPGGDASVGLF